MHILHLAIHENSFELIVETFEFSQKHSAFYQRTLHPGYVAIIKPAVPRPHAK